MDGCLCFTHQFCYQSLPVHTGDDDTGKEVVGYRMWLSLSLNVWYVYVLGFSKVFKFFFVSSFVILLIAIYKLTLLIINLILKDFHILHIALLVVHIFTMRVKLSL